MWVKIKSCERSTAWYADKIGTIQKVTNEIFPPDFILISKKQNKKGLYPMISSCDAEVIPSSNIANLFNRIRNIIYEK